MFPLCTADEWTILGSSVLSSVGGCVQFLCDSSCRSVLKLIWLLWFGYCMNFCVQAPHHLIRCVLENCNDHQNFFIVFCCFITVTNHLNFFVLVAILVHIFRTDYFQALFVNFVLEWSCAIHANAREHWLTNFCDMPLAPSAGFSPRCGFFCWHLKCISPNFSQYSFVYLQVAWFELLLILVSSLFDKIREKVLIMGFHFSWLKF